jgi:hypothetical protein
MSNGNEIKADHIGIGTVLRRYERLFVPPNQREYAWQQENVDELFRDLKKAMPKGSYFLGTIVLTTNKNGQLEIADGQQRLATISIFLSVIRDYFEDRNLTNLKDDLNKFLYSIDRHADKLVPVLTLNVQDRDFFASRILPAKTNPERSVKPSKASHRLIAGAQSAAIQYITDLLKPEPASEHVRVLNKWVDFIRDSARVIVLAVPNALGAFILFETMNYRGVRTTQADLVKNFLFGEAEADNRIADAQNKWASMAGKLEVLDEDDITLVYIRQMAISYWGHITEKALYEHVTDKANGAGSALSYLTKLDESANYYAAIRTPTHVHWKDYPEGMIKAVRTLASLPTVPLKPLMLAVARHFTKPEALKAFRLFVSWVVRFLIVGGGRSGRVEVAYADCAKAVSSKSMGSAQPHFQKAEDLANFMHPAIVPNHAEFLAKFKIANADGGLARYYLRALEEKHNSLPEPEWIPNEEPDINLEHVLPQNPDNNWPGVDPEDAKANYKRLGNLALLLTCPHFLYQGL